MVHLEAYRQAPEFWAQVVEQSCLALSAEAGTFFELSENQKELHVLASYGVRPARLSQASFPVDKGISGWAATHRRSLCVNDVDGDSRFNPDVDLQMQFKTVAILCAPVALPDRLYGVIEILNPRERPFSAEDVEFLEALAGAAAALYKKR